MTTVYNDFTELCSEKALVKYIRRKPTKMVGNQKIKAPPVGVLVADLVPNEDGQTSDVRIGWSLCNRKDVFDRRMGLGLAARRMSKNRHENIPDSMKDELAKFKERCARYFKQPVTV